MTTHCEVMSINEGGACDDGDSCTLVDRCREGKCVGEGCRNPALCAISSDCLRLNAVLNVAIRLGEGDRMIQGAQFSVQYDPSELTLATILPGSACDLDSPFSNQVTAMVDEAAGEIFYAVGVGLGGPTGTRGPAALACLTFLHLGQPGGVPGGAGRTYAPRRHRSPGQRHEWPRDSAAATDDGRHPPRRA